MLKPIESNIVSNISEVARRTLDTLDDAADLTRTYADLGMDGTLTNNDLDAGGFKFTKGQLTALIGAINALYAALTATERAKFYLVARQRNLR